MVQSPEGKNDVIIISLNGTVGVVTLGGWDIVPCVPDLVQRLSGTVLIGQSPACSSSKNLSLLETKKKEARTDGKIWRRNCWYNKEGVTEGNNYKESLLYQEKGPSAMLKPLPPHQPHCLRWPCCVPVVFPKLDGQEQPVPFFISFISFSQIFTKLTNLRRLREAQFPHIDKYPSHFCLCVLTVAAHQHSLLQKQKLPYQLPFPLSLCSLGGIDCVLGLQVLFQYSLVFSPMFSFYT